MLKCIENSRHLYAGVYVWLCFYAGMPNGPGQFHWYNIRLAEAETLIKASSEALMASSEAPLKGHCTAISFGIRLIAPSPAERCGPAP